MEDTDILVPRLILDSRASILLPPNMDEMSSERIGLLYPNQPKPDQALVYGDEGFWLSLTLTEEVSSKKALRTMLCQYRRLLMKKFRGTEIGEVYCVESVIQGEKTYYFPICTNGVTGGTCQLIFLCLIKGKEMIGTVCCSAEGWHSKTTLFRKIIGSVVDLTGTWEYTIRSKKLYEKAKEYYRDY